MCENPLRLPQNTTSQYMQTSLNWLQDYLDLSDHTPEQISEMLTAIGLEVEGMETVESLPGGLRGLVIGEVKTCGAHPNADRLSLTTVDIGQDDLLQIVCGAPNVAAGQKVVVATVGTQLHPTDGDPFTIKKGKIRGEVSEGMICAEDEIGLGHDHDGIIVLPEEAPVGQAAADYYQVETDTVFDIGLTPNRSDATCHKGVAEDLAAYLKINKGYLAGIQPPDLSHFQEGSGKGISVKVEDPAACPRYTGITLTGIQVGPSPDWLQHRLRSIGLKPKNNIVDITNFILHDMGQPLHAFDASRIGAGGIVVQPLSEGTTFVTLDEQERRLRGEDLMICDAAGNGLCMAGVFGGIGSGVTENTTEVFLESAHFDPEWIRRTSMHHNLRTDAARVYEKGSDPAITVDALKRAVLLILDLAGGEVASPLVDVYPAPIEPVVVELRYHRVRRLVGVDIPAGEIQQILEALQMEVQEIDQDTLSVKVPTNKSDVLREVDLIEEILRIYDLNKVPLPDSMRVNHQVAPFPDPREMQQAVSELLVAQGFSEMMALSLSQSQYYERVLERPEEELVFINNTSNVQLDIMRPDMLLSALEAVQYNQNRQQTSLKLFEFGKTYGYEQEQLQEENRLSLVITGQPYPESWRQPQVEADYYHLKAMVALVLQRMGIGGFQQRNEEQRSGFLFSRLYHRGPQELVRFGKVASTVLNAMEVRGPVFFADFRWDALKKAAGKPYPSIQEPTRFPTTRRDLALVLDKSVRFEEVEAVARKTEKKLLQDINLFDVYENEEQIGAGKKSYAVSYLFAHPEKTLKDKEVDKVMQKLIQQYEKKLGAAIR